MSLNRRVYVSAPRSIRLDPFRIKIKEAIVREIERLEYRPQMFLDESGGTELAAGAGWSLEEVERVASRCVGAVIIGLPFWKTATKEGKKVWLPTDYCQYEGAVAHAYGLPILTISVGIEQRVIFGEHARCHTVSIPLRKALSSLKTEAFLGPLESWRHEIEQRYDVFLGYCSANKRTAAQIKRCLESLGASVEDYAMDFRAGSSILAQIELARARCSGGVFLFGENEQLEGKTSEAAPRDNVVFEAGYFISAKGPERCLIIRHGKAKMPADIGGSIYVALAKTASVSSIVGRLKDFLAALSPQQTPLPNPIGGKKEQRPARP